MSEKKSDQPKAVEIGVSLELLEETLAKILVASLPVLPIERHEEFAISAGRALRLAYREMLLVADPVRA